MIISGSENYTASVVKIANTYPLAGLDNLVGTMVFGNQCLVGKNTKPGDIMVFFPAECQLSDELVKQNNWYRHSELNVDITKKGFFDDNRRVRAIKFKGHLSTGFLTESSSIEKLCGLVKVGDEFNTLNGIEICKKYIIPRKTIANNEPKLKKKELLIPSQFRFHENTAQLVKNLHKFGPDDLISITCKYHGTSFVCGNVLIDRKLRWYERLLKRFIPIVTTKYANIYSSRSVVKDIDGERQLKLMDKFSLMLNDVWASTNKRLRDYLEPGITVYGEIVGFTSTGKYIQPEYDYGCKPHESKPIIYRITYTTPQGKVIEFSWQQIKEWCKCYGFEHPVEYHYGKIKHLPVGEFIDVLQEHFNLEQDCELCNNKVPAEGIVVRLDGKHSFEAYKLKSKRFLLKETELLDKGEVNLEDAEVQNV